MMHSMIDTAREQRANVSMKIAEFRKKRGMTAAAFGRLVGVSRGTVGRWEAGNHFPTAKTIQRITEATAGKVSPADIFKPKEPT